jgi:Ca2+-binding EF-hand superfamily protein
MQKCPPNQGEEGFLAKCFKFFDIQNKGEVNFDQFYRTVEKVGVIITKEVRIPADTRYRTVRECSNTTIKTVMGN